MAATASATAATASGTASGTARRSAALLFALSWEICNIIAYRVKPVRPCHLPLGDEFS
jgi:hypothetical protein